MQTVTDLDVGNGLRFTRHYASDLEPTAAIFVLATGPMGFDWIHSFEWKLEFTATNQSTAGEFYLVRRPLKAPAAFFRIGSSGPLQTKPGSGSLTLGSGTTTFVDPDGTRAVFNSTLQLTEYQPPGETPISVSYGTQSATYTRGSSSLTVLRYGAGESWPGYVKSVSGGGETVSYTYTTVSYSGKIFTQLATVTTPDRSTPNRTDTLTWTYTYAAVPAKPPGRLTSVVRQGTTLGQWTWTSVAGAFRVTATDEQALEQALSLSYATETGGILKTTVKDGANQTLAEFRSKNGRLKSVTGNGGPGAPVPFATGTLEPAPNGTTADMNRWNTQVDANGHTTLYEGFVRDGAPSRVVEGWTDADASGGFTAGDGALRRREFTWHPTLQKPLTISEPSTLTSGLDHIVSYDYDDPAAPGDTSTPNESPTDLVSRRIEAGKTIDASGAVVSASPAIVSYAYDSLRRIASISGPRAESYAAFATIPPAASEPPSSAI